MENFALWSKAKQKPMKKQQQKQQQQQIVWK